MSNQLSVFEKSTSTQTAIMWFLQSMRETKMLVESCSFRKSHKTNMAFKWEKSLMQRGSMTKQVMLARELHCALGTVKRFRLRWVRHHMPFEMWFSLKQFSTEFAWKTLNIKVHFSNMPTELALPRKRSPTECTFQVFAIKFPAVVVDIVITVDFWHCKR